MRNILAIILIVPGLCSAVYAQPMALFALLVQIADGEIQLAIKEIHVGRMDHNRVTVSMSTNVNGEVRTVVKIPPLEANSDGNLIDTTDAEKRKKDGRPLPDNAVFSPDRKRTAYIVRRDSSMVAVVDGIEQNEYYDIGMPPLFSPDGKRVVYVATRKDDMWMVVLDGVEGKEYDRIERVPVFSSDSKQVLYIAREKGKAFAVANGIEKKKYNSIYSPVFSPDGKRLAYGVRGSRGSNGKSFMVLDEVEGKEYSYVARPVFSPDSKRLAYAARHRDKWTIVVDGVEGKERHDMVGSIIFSHDSKRLAYTAERGDQSAARSIVVLVEGIYRTKRGGEMMTVMAEKIQGKTQYQRVWIMVFSPDSKRLAYKVVEDDHRFIVADGMEQTRYEWVSHPVFSPDSRRLVYSAKRKRGSEHFLVVDGVEMAEYDRLSTGIVFDSENPAKFYTFMGRGEDTFRLEIEVIEQ